MIDDFYSSFCMFCIGFLSLSISFFISTFTLLQHLLHYTSHRLQRYIVRILVFLPIYGVITFILLLIPKLFDLLSMLRNIWEGFLIHSFLFLMLEYCGGETACGEAISKNPSVIRHLWPLSLIHFFSLNEDIPLNVGFVKRCKMCTIQYVISRLVFSLLLIGVHISGNKWSGTLSFFSSLILSISLYVALYSLALFYFAISRHPALAKANSLTKFFSLKLCFAFSFYQGLILDLFMRVSFDRSVRIKSFVVLVETIIFALVQHNAYRVTEFYQPPNQIDTTGMTKLESLTRYLQFCLDDLRTMKTSEGMGTILSSAGKALDMSDFFTDTYYNISDKYKEHSIFVSHNVIDSDIVLDTNSQEVKDVEMNTVDNFADFQKVKDEIDNDERCNEISKLEFI
ncbi:uncharacterized protein TA13495 [Theileria annulata]|uniref:Organic solute transporter Ostalpha n=1 Tax=Theileria annulata TaxID=5874 RepID=Q4UEJ9_THEAN|nr:uncharacterized protein TA13495 [Theileria annulata]CAI74490.1 hypothetical protein, conserved [Theileria annulata]|eukprot:XP_952222.1 hypothetical protein, conserved [Theileria annulata]